MNAENLRTLGQSPYDIAVVHGGPGAGGEMAPVARELGQERGVLEPIQTATSVTGQVEELRTTLEQHGDLPLTLIGFSWGAWLSLMVAAYHPALVQKLVLISSGPFEEKYVAGLSETRMSRLSLEERTDYDRIVQLLSNPATEDKDRLLSRLGALSWKTDAYDPVEEEPPAADAVEPQGEIFHAVWEEAAEMRRSGRLLALTSQIRCPVVALHGDFDPHPAEGVRAPLSARLQQFRFVLLPHCGHTPWIERQAREEFYARLRSELS
jgi:pimeloyl-ACP methyl ester carboxylesterase